MVIFSYNIFKGECYHDRTRKKSIFACVNVLMKLLNDDAIREATAQNPQPSTPSADVSAALTALNNLGDTLATPTTKEKPMKIRIDVPGVSINATPRPDGRYQGYAVRDGKKRYFYGRTKEAVEEKIAAFIEEENNEKKRILRKPSVIFGDFVKNWIEIYKKPNLKPTSLQNLYNDIKPALARFESTNITKISGDDVQQLFTDIRSGRLRKLCFVYLNTIFEKARKQGVIKRNPCDDVEIKAYKSKKITGLTPEKQTAFLGAIQSHKYSLLYRLLLASGIRIGEALALERSDFDTATESFTVSRNVVFIKDKRIVQTPKTESSVRTIPLPPELFREIMDTNAAQLFPYTYNAINHALQGLSKRIGFQVTAHKLRHTYSDRLEEAGVPPKVKQYLLGHAKLDTTQNVYTDTQQHYVNRNSELVRNAIFPSKTDD